MRPCGENVTLPYTLAIHRGDLSKENVHCHLVFSDRGNDAVDRNPELWFKRANKKDPEKGGGPKVFGLMKKKWLLQTRADLAAVANRHLEKGGYKDRIDHRSLKDQGINRIPQIHVGPAAIRMAEKGLASDRLDRWKAINKANRVDKKEAAALTATWEKHMAEGRQYEAAEGEWEQMFGKDWRARYEEAEKLNRAEAEKTRRQIAADLKREREERDREWKREIAASRREMEWELEVEKAERVKHWDRLFRGDKKADEKVAEPAKKATAERVIELTSTAAKPKKAPEDEKVVGPKENEILERDNAWLKECLLEYKKLEWERAGSRGPQPERLGVPPKDVEALGKENEMLRSALEIYKEHYDGPGQQQSKSRGHEME